MSETIDEAEWSWLKPHLQRDAIIVVSTELDLQEVGRAVASDSSQEVQKWIELGWIAKPSSDQIQDWDLTPTRRFKSLVVRPYVLIQVV